MANDFSPEAFDATIPERVAEHVRRGPDQEAIRIGQQSLTYAQLNQRASSIAKELVENLGTESEPICLLLEKTTDQVVGLLAILYAGKYVIPLERSDPKARIKAILDFAEPKAVVTDSSTAPLCRELLDDSSRILVLDRSESELPDPSDFDPVSVSPHDLATVLFTSGSTGEPKGVMQSHRNWLQVVHRYTSAIQIESEDRLFRPGGFSFAAGVRALLGALTSGASLVSEDKTTGEIVPFLTEQQASILHTPVNLFRHLLDSVEQGSLPPDLRCLFVAGDALRSADAKR
ncbi:MAG: AMP-binding protein, partial [Verrucomicrobiales bacterium]|nr:AMP-binding protein [Verrucomicrobiales bacterium]